MTPYVSSLVASAHASNVVNPEKVLRDGRGAGRVAAESRALSGRARRFSRRGGGKGVCLLDRDAGGAERLRQLSRCFLHLLSERAAPRDVSESVGVLRRGATGMR